MKKWFNTNCVVFFYYASSKAQSETTRLQDLETQLEVLSFEVPGLNENVKSEIKVNDILLSNFLLALSELHGLNVNVSQDLDNLSISPRFPNVTVKDLLLFLCKEYRLTIDFSGNILSFKLYNEVPPPILPKSISVYFNPESNLLSLDLKADNLYETFKKITDVSGKNLVFTPEIENTLLTAYIVDSDFDTALEKLAFSNNLYFEKSKDGFYRFESLNIPPPANKELTSTPASVSRNYRRNSKLQFKVLDIKNQLLEVDFSNVPIQDIVHDIGNELGINIFTANPLDAAGTASFRAKRISFDELLNKVFETHSNTSSNQGPNGQNTGNQKRFTFKKEGDIYYFGTADQLSLRKVEVIHMKHRSVDLLSEPFGNNSNRRSAGRSSGITNQTNFTSYNNSNMSNQNLDNVRTGSSVNNNTNRGQSLGFIETLVPEELKNALNIRVDTELNKFYVVGSAFDIERFKQFVQKLDQKVPVILIEVMILEVRISSNMETGISWGIGESPVETTGSIFPSTDITLGAETINKIIGGFDGFGSFNIGQVVPNFYATVKAMEANGDLKVKSTPKITTLNGHRAYFSNGQTSYYAVTERNIIGSDNPQTNEITNYLPVDAELGLTIKPLVAGDGEITLDISVIQSSFGSRIDDNAPPDINSREFNSIIRMRDQDIVILGGLDEDYLNKSGSGVPFLARVPIIKYLFSRQVREGRKSKLTVLIKPTVYN